MDTPSRSAVLEKKRQKKQKKKQKKHKTKNKQQKQKKERKLITYEQKIDHTNQTDQLTHRSY